MQKIASFTVNHDNINPGIYISRIDGDVVTYDMRTRKPNMGDYMDNLTMHSVEHMFATYVRNSQYSDNIIYFGPMGCRTGFYCILAGDLGPADVYKLVYDSFNFAAEYIGEIPGATAIGCGNYRDMNLPLANKRAKSYIDILDNASAEQFVYP